MGDQWLLQSRGNSSLVRPRHVRRAEGSGPQAAWQRDARVAVPGPLIMLWLLATATPAEAYLDPSTGSMILSAIVGLLATVALALKTYWYRVRAFLRRTAYRSGDGARTPDESVEPGPGTRS